MEPENLPPAQFSSAPLPGQPEAEQQQNRKNRLVILAVIFTFIILLTIIGFLVIAVVKKNAAERAANAAAGTEQYAPVTKKIVATHDTKNENIDFIMYTPRQTANNTTIDFVLKNACESNCPAKSYAAEQYSPSHAGKDLTDMYLIDDSAAEKYTVVTDTRDIGLMSPQCYGNLKPGQKIDCFMSFAKVPSGSTVSLVMRDFRIDNILVP